MRERELKSKANCQQVGWLLDKIGPGYLTLRNFHNNIVCSLSEKDNNNDILIWKSPLCLILYRQVRTLFMLLNFLPNHIISNVCQIRCIRLVFCVEESYCDLKV